MTTTKKQAKKGVKSNLPKTAHEKAVNESKQILAKKTRQKSEEQTATTKLLSENSAEKLNEKLLAETLEKPQTILEQSNEKRAQDTGDTTQDTGDNLKKFVAEFYKSEEEKTLNDLCLSSLFRALCKIYGVYADSIFRTFAQDTKNGLFAVVDSVAENVKFEREIKVKTGDTEKKYYIVSMDVPTTVAAILARFRGWLKLAKRLNKECIKPIAEQERKQDKISRATKAVENMDENAFIIAAAKKLGIPVDIYKSMIEQAKKQAAK